MSAVVQEPQQRLPPQDLEAEQCVLGSVLLSSSAFADVVELLKVADFYQPVHGVIYDAALGLYGRGEPVDAITVAAALARRGELARVGGATYLHQLTAQVPTPANAGYYARIVRERSIFRRLTTAGSRIAQLGFDAQGDVDEAVDRAQMEVHEVGEQRSHEECLPLSSFVDDVITEVEAAGHREGAMLGVPTGYADLDRLLHGLQGSQFLLIAGRPAMGKSVAGLGIAAHASVHQGVPAVFFSLEMSRGEIMMRLLAAEARVALQTLRTGSLSEADWERLASASDRVREAPLFVDDSASTTLMSIRSKCRRLQQTKGLGLVVVDYLQLLGSSRRFDNRQQEVAEFSRSLKLLAKELDVPVVALSQLNRGSEQRADKRPMLSDLRESGSLEQDPDIVVLIHREDVYDKNSPRAGEADLIVAKHRNGPTGVVTVAFQGHYSRFVDMADS